MALSSSLPQGTKLEQWDIPDLNKLLLGNGLAQIDVSNKDLLTKTIIYLDSSGVSSISPATEVATDWTSVNDGVCTQDTGSRSIRDKDGTVHLFRMPTGFYQREYKNGTYDTSDIGAVVRPGGRWTIENIGSRWRIKFKLWATTDDYYNQCKRFAESKNASVFGLQSGEWCLVGNTNDLALGKTDSQYTILNKSECTRNVNQFPAGTGHHWKNMVYTRTIPTPIPRKFDATKANAVLSSLRSQGYTKMEDVLRFFNFDIQMQ